MIDRRVTTLMYRGRLHDLGSRSNFENRGDFDQDQEWNLTKPLMKEMIEHDRVVPHSAQIGKGVREGKPSLKSGYIYLKLYSNS